MVNLEVVILQVVTPREVSLQMVILQEAIPREGLL